MAGAFLDFGKLLVDVVMALLGSVFISWEGNVSGTRLTVEIMREHVLIMLTLHCDDTL